VDPPITPSLDGPGGRVGLDIIVRSGTSDKPPLLVPIVLSWRWRLALLSQRNGRQRDQ
jgi:hypothetical protein